MTSVHLRPYPGHETKPFLSQGADLLDLAGVLLCNTLEHVQLVVHHPKVRMWDHPAVDHGHVSVQSLAGEDDALIGFGWGHGGTLPEGFAAW